MHENLEAILEEWGPGGGLERCLAGEDYTPPFACDWYGRAIPWSYVRGSWTAAEDAVLREHYYEKGSLGCLVLCPTKTKEQIRNRGRALGLQTDKRGTRGRKAQT